MTPPRRHARARRSHPATSHTAAKKATKKAGGLKVTQQAVMVVMRTLGREVLDEELIAEYRKLEKAMMLPTQSESGIRSRRSELSQAGLLELGQKKKMRTGGTGNTWKVAPPNPFLAGIELP